MDELNTLFLDENTKIPYVDIVNDIQQFDIGTRLIIGPMSCGKTLLSKDLALSMTKQHITNLFYVNGSAGASTNKQKQFYPSTITYKTLDDKTITDMNMFVNTAKEEVEEYNKSTSMEFLYKFFEGKNNLDKYQEFEKIVSNYVDNDKIIENKEIMKKELLKNILLRYIRNNYHDDNHQVYGQVIKNAKRYRPRFHIIIDDVSDNIGRYFKGSKENQFSNLINQLNTKARHYCSLTIFIHTCNNIDRPGVRKNFSQIWFVGKKACNDFDSYQDIQGDEKIQFRNISTALCGNYVDSIESNKPKPLYNYNILIRVNVPIESDPMQQQYYWTRADFKRVQSFGIDDFGEKSLNLLVKHVLHTEKNIVNKEIEHANEEAERSVELQDRIKKLVKNTNYSS